MNHKKFRIAFIYDGSITKINITEKCQNLNAAYNKITWKD